MAQATWLFAAAGTAACGVAFAAASSFGHDKTAQANAGMTAKGTNTEVDIEKAKQMVVSTTVPPGYRDWKFVSAAHEAGELNDIRVVIGNDIAIEAYRAGKPFPDGAIIGRVAWKMVPSEENNKTFGKEQSFVPGEAPDWYLQFMEKNTNKYGATGGWGYSNFGKDLKPTTDKKTMYACFMCHQAVAARDYIFTRYSP